MISPKDLDNYADALIDLYMASDGEEFHPEYRKNKKLFRRLMLAEIRTKRMLVKYFENQSKRVSKLIDWSIYEPKKASISDFITARWEDEKIILRILLSEALKEAIVAGGKSTEEETKIDIGWGVNYNPAITFLEKYTIKLSGQITDTTVSRIKKSLSSSIEQGLNIKEASKKISDIIDDPVRAKMIAQTESVRAYSEGRLAVAEEIGAEYKQWSATLERCELCGHLDGQIVKIKDSFSDLNGKEVLAPPRHPRCRCLVRIKFKK